MFDIQNSEYSTVTSSYTDRLDSAVMLIIIISPSGEKRLQAGGDV